MRRGESKGSAPASKKLGFGATLTPPKISHLFPAYPTRLSIQRPGRRRLPTIQSTRYIHSSPTTMRYGQIWCADSASSLYAHTDAAPRRAHCDLCSPRPWSLFVAEELICTIRLIPNIAYARPCRSYVAGRPCWRGCLGRACLQ